MERGVTVCLPPCHVTSSPLLLVLHATRMSQTQIQKYGDGNRARYVAMAIGMRECKVSSGSGEF
jgi:hypothetical protein